MSLLQLAQSDLNVGTTQTVLTTIKPFMGVFFIAFIGAFIATPIMRMLAIKNGIVDWPDLHRKNHIEPIAYLGGIGIFFGWFAGIAYCYIASGHDGNNHLDFFMLISIVLGALAITLTGLFDDVYGISPRVKVGGQLFAAAALAHQKIGIELIENISKIFEIPAFPGSDLLYYILGTAVIAIFVVGGCNALNLIDGLDGLAGGVTAIASLGFLVLAALAANDSFEFSLILVMCLAILGATLGYLPYNFNPASIFMGDAGSLLLGFLCISTILLFSKTGTESLKLVTAALIIFALPITDTSLAIFRRKMRGKPIMSPDNEHMHHLFRRSGLSVKKSVFCMYAIAILFAVIGCTMVALEFPWRFMLAVAFFIYGFILVTSYKHGHKLALLDKIKQEQDAAQPDEEPIPAQADA
ncbi:WecA-like glycosyltransferase [Poriferisphaera corsica]|uniref:WecA-like glycosyltransferase n=1 Tax=Poriferisphaera corsica TaxID=2528020 RepID=A0A517YXK8_9BACT|nr:MraY family glycosyltransferase [Poriferisphaera corsica]QDU34956.1 WecA-like glycosyltransferase [Poriferisphaera corsica]